jgi:hypothetical protein
VASSSKKKTTMAKLNRESRLRDRRMLKQAKKDARRQAAADGTFAPDGTSAPEDALGAGEALHAGDALHAEDERRP